MPVLDALLRDDSITVLTEEPLLEMCLDDVCELLLLSLLQNCILESLSKALHSFRLHTVEPQVCMPDSSHPKPLPLQTIILTMCNSSQGRETCAR